MFEGMPKDLVALPTAPWDKRPAELPLVIEEVRTAIWMCRGNVTQAAELLKVTSLRLRNFIKNSRYLTAELEEAGEQLVDIAESVAYEALTDSTDPSRRDAMARFIMGGKGRSRGHGAGGGKVSVGVNAPGGAVVIQWGDGQAVVAPPERNEKVIEGVVNDS